MRGFLPAWQAGKAPEQRRTAERHASLLASAPDSRRWNYALLQHIDLGGQDFAQRVQLFG
jgi:hypothetical protein